MKNIKLDLKHSNLNACKTLRRLHFPTVNRTQPAELTTELTELTAELTELTVELTESRVEEHPSVTATRNNPASIKRAGSIPDARVMKQIPRKLFY